jgi:hypothetical protein
MRGCRVLPSNLRISLHYEGEAIAVWPVDFPMLLQKYIYHSILKGQSSPIDWHPATIKPYISSKRDLKFACKENRWKTVMSFYIGFSVK